jgi:hypothetical protein
MVRTDLTILAKQPTQVVEFVEAGHSREIDSDPAGGDVKHGTPGAHSPQLNRRKTSEVKLNRKFLPWLTVFWSMFERKVSLFPVNCRRTWSLQYLRVSRHLGEFIAELHLQDRFRIKFSVKPLSPLRYGWCPPQETFRPIL